MEVPYHSNAHAADCANSFEVMLSSSGQELHPLRLASCFIAALGHDVGHPGYNNAYMMNSRHELAVTYNDRSCLENFHAAELERLIAEVHLLFLPKELEKKERQVRISYILSTDMSKHMQDLADLRLKLGCKDFDPLNNVSDQQLATLWLFRASDIAHSAKPWAIHQKWSMRVVQERLRCSKSERDLHIFSLYKIYTCMCISSIPLDHLHRYVSSLIWPSRSTYAWSLFPVLYERGRSSMPRATENVTWTCPSLLSATESILT